MATVHARSLVLIACVVIATGLVLADDPEDDAPPLDLTSSGPPSLPPRQSSANSSSCDVTTCDDVTPTTPAPAIAKPTWMRIFDACQLTCTLIGCIANLLTLFTLVAKHRGFARFILVLLRHQSLVDAWVCAMASILILQPFMWLTGVHYLDVLICYCWHGQALYWGGVTLSTYNLMAIALERFLAVCHPFKHGPVSRMSSRTMALLFAALYSVVLLVTHGTYIQTRFTDDGRCVNEYAFEGQAIELYFFAFVIFTYLATYLVPVVFMTLLYGLVIHRLNVRIRETKLGPSRIIDRASTELTKTAIAVTAIFIVTIGYDLHYYLLGYTGVAVYELGTPLQKVGVFLSNLNSVANPFVYALLMPMYRRAVRNTFMPCLKTAAAGGGANRRSERAGLSVSGGGTGPGALQSEGTRSVDITVVG